jgi:chemotaxis response regulator CheB
MRIGLLSISRDELHKQKLISDALGCEIVTAAGENDLISRLDDIDFVWAHGIEVSLPGFDNVLVSDGDLPLATTPEGKAWARRLRSALLTSGIEATFVVCIASSTGGVGIVKRLLSELPVQQDTAIVVVQHQDLKAQSVMIEQFARGSQWNVRSSDDAIGIVGGSCTVITGEMTINFGAQGKIVKSDRRWSGRFSPSIDHVAGSLAQRWGEDTLVVYLSGLEGEGPSSARIAERAGASVMVQSIDSTTTPGMAQSVLNVNKELCEVNPIFMAGEINRWLLNRRKSCLF